MVRKSECFATYRVEAVVRERASGAIPKANEVTGAPLTTPTTRSSPRRPPLCSRGECGDPYAARPHRQPQRTGSIADTVRCVPLCFLRTLQEGQTPSPASHQAPSPAAALAPPSFSLFSIFPRYPQAHLSRWAEPFLPRVTLLTVPGLLRTARSGGRLPS